MFPSHFKSQLTLENAHSRRNTKGHTKKGENLSILFYEFVQFPLYKNKTHRKGNKGNGLKVDVFKTRETIWLCRIRA